MQVSEVHLTREVGEQWAPGRLSFQAAAEAIGGDGASARLPVCGPGRPFWSARIDRTATFGRSLAWRPGSLRRSRWTVRDCMDRRHPSWAFEKRGRRGSPGPHEGPCKVPPAGGCFDKEKNLVGNSLSPGRHSPHETAGGPICARSAMRIRRNLSEPSRPPQVASGRCASGVLLRQAEPRRTGPLRCQYWKFMNRVRKWHLARSGSAA